jgi:hypothetical protein
MGKEGNKLPCPSCAAGKERGILIVSLEIPLYVAMKHLVVGLFFGAEIVPVDILGAVFLFGQDMGTGDNFKSAAFVFYKHGRSPLLVDCAIGLSVALFFRTPNLFAAQYSCCSGEVQRLNFPFCAGKGWGQALLWKKPP